MSIYTEIKECRACHSRELKSVLDLGDQYIVNFVTEAETDKSDKAPIHLVVCRNCTLVQLKHTVQPDRLFRQFWYYSAVNNTMRSHLKDLVTQACTLQNVEAGDYIVDIGANDGELLGNFPRNVKTIGIEPARNMYPLLRENCTIALNDYFSQSAVAYLKEHRIKAKHIYAISMFYDIADPDDFLEDIKKVLHKDGIFVIQMNYLRTMLQNVAVDNLLHEHLVYYNIQSLEPLLCRAKLKIFHISTNDLNGGSIRLYICHEEADKMTYFNYMHETVEESKYFGNGRLFEHLKIFADRVRDSRMKLQAFVKKCRDERKSIYAYGASTRGNSLLQVMGLKFPQITYAVEKNPNKFGKYMAGTNIEIISEEEMHKAPPDYLLVLPYFFFNEFKDREREYLQNGGKMLVPLPNPFVYDGGGNQMML